MTVVVDFMKLEQAFTTTSAVFYVNDDTFLITTDSSSFTTGAVLSQGSTGRQLLIAYASRTICNAETKFDNGAVTPLIVDTETARA